MRKGFWQSFNEGYGSTKRVGDDIEAFLDKKGLADAYAQGDIKNTNTGTDAAVEYGNAAQGLDQASFDSPEQYAAAEKAYTDAASQALQQGQGYAIGDKQFTNRAEAEAAQPGLRNAAVAAYYGGKGEVGKQMEYEKEARAAKLQGMQMEGAEMDLAQKKQMKSAYDTYQKDLEAAKGDFWNVAKARFNGNNGHLGEGVYKDATIDIEETPEGAIVWAKDAKGNLLGQAQHVTRQQVENDIIHSYFAKTDPGKAIEMKRHDKERGEDVDHRTLTLAEQVRNHKETEKTSRITANAAAATAKAHQSYYGAQGEGQTLANAELKRQQGAREDYGQLSEARAAYLASPLAKTNPDGLKQALASIDARMQGLLVKGANSSGGTDKSLATITLKDAPKEVQTAITEIRAGMPRGRSFGDSFGSGEASDYNKKVEQFTRANPEYAHLVQKLDANGMPAKNGTGAADKAASLLDGAGSGESPNNARAPAHPSQSVAEPRRLGLGDMARLWQLKKIAQNGTLRPEQAAELESLLGQQSEFANSPD
jgi:hypothetical protein